MAMTDKGYRCDAEIGKLGAWRTCLRRAVVGCTTRNGSELHYCGAHQSRVGSQKVSASAEHLRRMEESYRGLMKWAGVK